MTAPIQVDPDYRSNRRAIRAPVDRAFPHRKSYLGFTLGFVATIVVVLFALGWWLVHAGMLQIWWDLPSGLLQIQLRWS